MFKLFRILFTHGVALAAGFALGIYLLPILIAPEGPSNADVIRSAQQAQFSGQFRKDLTGSDFLHWGEGNISISSTQVVFMGSLAPGPDYKLYLTPQPVQNEAEFNAVKAQSVRVGDVKTFDKFILDMPPNVNPAEYRGVVVWCETFGEFITSASYR